MKQILVTGGAGFIGSHLTESLLARGDRVRVVDNESTGQLDNLASVRDHERFEFVAGSVDDADLVAQLTADVDEVYHLAAAVGVQLIASSDGDDPYKHHSVAITAPAAFRASPARRPRQTVHRQQQRSLRQKP